MQINTLVLKFSDKNDTYCFDKKINIVDDQIIFDELKNTNIKNESSSLVIDSLNSLPIYDVVQLKINVKETGVFLVNFQKDKLNDEDRQTLISKISELKDNVIPTIDTQVLKIEKLLKIIASYNPIYVSFRNDKDDEVQITDEMFANISEKIDYSFPILILKKKQRIKKEHKTKIAKAITKKTAAISFPLFTVDYIFISIFCILFSFGLTTGIFEIYNGQSIATFLLILSAIFIGINYFAFYSSIYKHGVEQYKNLKFFLILYLIVGLAIGLISGYTVSKFVLKNEVENIDFNEILKYSILISAVLGMLSIPVNYLSNFVYKKIKKL